MQQPRTPSKDVEPVRVLSVSPLENDHATLQAISSKELVKTALNVLMAWMDGRKPVPADVKILRTAFPSLSQRPSDDLACYVIHNLSGRTFKESGLIGVEQPNSTRLA
jgi:hypothetical protein